MESRGVFGGGNILMGNFIYKNLKSGYAKKDYLTKYYAYKKTADNKYYILDSITTPTGVVIDLGIKGNSNLTHYFKFIPKEVTGNNILGYYGNDSNDYRLFNASSIIYFDMGSDRISGNSCQVNLLYDFEIGNYYVKNYGESINLISGSAQSYSSNETIKIQASIVFYLLQTKQNDKLIGDFVPVQDDDGNIGIYNLVDNTFHTDTTKVLTAGNKFVEEVSANESYDYIVKVPKSYLIDLTGEGNIKKEKANVKLIGGIVLSENFELSNFSKFNYAVIDKIPLNIDINKLEIQLKFKTGTSSARQDIIEQGISNYGTPQLVLLANTHYLEGLISPDGATWIKSTATDKNISLSMETIYYARMSWDKNAKWETGDGATCNFKVEISTDGENWDLVRYGTSNTIFWNQNMFIGNDYGTSPASFTDGTVYLKECYIKINDNLWWEGVTFPQQNGGK